MDGRTSLQALSPRLIYRPDVRMIKQTCIREMRNYLSQGQHAEEHSPIHLAAKTYELWLAIIGIVVDR